MLMIWLWTTLTDRKAIFLLIQTSIQTNRNAVKKESREDYSPRTFWLKHGKYGIWIGSLSQSFQRFLNNIPDKYTNMELQKIAILEKVHISWRY
jgi:hypothetical protein